MQKIKTGMHGCVQLGWKYIMKYVDSGYTYATGGIWGDKRL